MILQQTALALIIAVFIASSTEAQHSTNCKQSCGDGKSAKHVLYPFGFSGKCGIQLSCSKNGDIKIGEFQVQNITSKSIFINLPENCSRSIHSISNLFEKYNYGVALNNTLLLQNCSSSASMKGCVFTSFFEQRLSLGNCGDTRCFSKERDGVEVVSNTDLKETNCTVLFSSISFDSSNLSVSLELQKLELVWWLNGNHKCDSNAIPEKVHLPAGQSGFRCHCKVGFHGDGFEEGLGCKRGDTSQEPSDSAGGRSDYEGDNAFIEMLWFYIGIAFGFNLSFWVVCTTLMYNTSWRRNYFRFSKYIGDWFFVKTSIQINKLKRRFQS